MNDYLLHENVRDNGDSHEHVGKTYEIENT